MNEELQVCRALICLLFRFAVKRGMIDGRDLIDMAMADLHLPPKVSARVIEAVNEAVREVVDNPRWPG